MYPLNKTVATESSTIADWDQSFFSKQPPVDARANAQASVIKITTTRKRTSVVFVRRAYFGVAILWRALLRVRCEGRFS